MKTTPMMIRSFRLMVSMIESGVRSIITELNGMGSSRISVQMVVRMMERIEAVG